MNRYSLNTGSCSCQRNTSVVEDYLRCAPCPPPMMSYEEFRNHTLNMLPKIDMCIISKRCIRDNSTAYAIDCPASLFDNCPETTTKSKDPTVDPSIIVTSVVLLGLLYAVTMVLLVLSVLFTLWKNGKCRCKCIDELDIYLSRDLEYHGKSTKSKYMYTKATQETEDNQASNIEMEENMQTDVKIEYNPTDESEKYHDAPESNVTEHSDGESESNYVLARETV